MTKHKAVRNSVSIRPMSKETGSARVYSELRHELAHAAHTRQFQVKPTSPLGLLWRGSRR